MTPAPRVAEDVPGPSRPLPACHSQAPGMQHAPALSRPPELIQELRGALRGSGPSNLTGTLTCSLTHRLSHPSPPGLRPSSGPDPASEPVGETESHNPHGQPRPEVLQEPRGRRPALPRGTDIPPASRQRPESRQGRQRGRWSGGRPGKVCGKLPWDGGGAGEPG